MESRPLPVLALACALAIAGASAAADPSASVSSETAPELRAAFADFLAQVERAEQAIHDPALDAPPPTDRGLAEGYRYLMGFVYASIERAFHEDPDFPYFRRSIPPQAKSTIDNADNLYLSARIDGEATYRIEGRAAAHGHWRGGPRAASGPLAPQYALFTAITHTTGDSGDVAELSPLVTANTGSLDTTELTVDADGRFEILLAPERPEGYEGNFIATRATRSAKGEQHTFTARYLIGRELFGDWSREIPLELHIVRVGMEGRAPEPITPAEATASLREAGRLVDAKMRFWNAFYVSLMDPYQEPGVTAPIDQAINEIAQPEWKTGVGASQATTTYGSTVYDLAPDEALIVEDRLRDRPVYTGFNLSNFWGESYDYANHVSSLNDFQARPDADGVVRYVVAHRDPGVANWVDTTGQRTGYISRRWAYTERGAELPTITTRKVRLDELWDHLPPDTRRTTPEQRRAQVAERQRHVQLRYRQF